METLELAPEFRIVERNWNENGSAKNIYVLLSEVKQDLHLWLHLLISLVETFNYLRIAINENCNLRCIYCMPEKGIASDKLKNTMNPNEISRILKVSSELGVNKVRFTGGEPLMHPHIISLIEMASRTPRI